MKVNQLLPGDRIADDCNGTMVDFEVVAVDQTGPRVQVTFQSILGLATASYNGNAYIAAAR